MDLNALKVQDEGRRMELRHPVTGEVLRYGDKDEKIMHLTIGSSDCPTYKSAQRKVIDRRLKEQQKFRSMKMTAAQLEEEATAALSAVTFSGKVFMDKLEHDITPGKVAVALYKEYAWIREQAIDFLEDRSNFL